MKRITVKIAGSEREPIDITIKPGTTAGGILSQLNLEGYVLIPRSGCNRFPSYIHPFFTNEVVYPLLRDGDILMAKTRAELEEMHLQSLLHSLELVDKYPQCFRSPFKE
jgi:hypothetical protein